MTAPSSHHSQASKRVPSSSTFQRKVWVWALLLSSVLLWFGTLDARHLVGSDEGRYAEISREMWASGDWITPRYNDLQYFEKPPLHMWMTAATYEVFGVGEWQARFFGACCGLLGIGLTVLAAQRWWGDRTAFWAGLVLTATPSWYLGSHFNSLDIGVSGALAVVLCATLLAQHPQASRRSRWGWMLLAWAGMALAVLTKGLIGVALPGLILVIYTLVSRDWGIWRRLHLVSGLAVLLALTVPWFWAVSARHPNFLHFFFVQEHFQRYTSVIHHREGPAWYFVPLFLLGFLPWLGLLPQMTRVAAGDRGQGEVGASTFRPALLAATWAVTIFAFFSASSSKLPGYILPIFPALAMLAGVAIERQTPKAWRRWLWVASSLFGALAVASLAAARMASGRSSPEIFQAYGRWLFVASVLMLAGGLLALWLHGRGREAAGKLAYGLCIYLGTTVAVLGHETYGRVSSGVDLVPAIERVLKPEMPLYGVKRLDHTLPFYLRHPLVMVQEPDELAFGVAQEPERWLPTMAAFEARWKSGPRGLAVMSPQTYQELADGALPMWVVARDTRRVVVANFPTPAP